MQEEEVITRRREREEQEWERGSSYLGAAVNGTEVKSMFGLRVYVAFRGVYVSIAFFPTDARQGRLDSTPDGVRFGGLGGTELQYTTDSWDGQGCGCSSTDTEGNFAATLRYYCTGWIPWRTGYHKLDQNDTSPKQKMHHALASMEQATTPADIMRQTRPGACQ